MQSAAFDKKGRLWEVEHGPQRRRRVQSDREGKNYGWPLVAYGEEYSGLPIRGAVTAGSGFEQPVYHWDPVIAPSGASSTPADAFPGWRGSLFIGGLKDAEARAPDARERSRER